MGPPTKDLRKLNVSTHLRNFHDTKPPNSHLVPGGRPPSTKEDGSAGVVGSDTSSFVCCASKVMSTTSLPFDLLRFAPSPYLRLFIPLVHPLRKPGVASVVPTLCFLRLNIILSFLLSSSLLLFLSLLFPVVYVISENVPQRESRIVHG